MKRDDFIKKFEDVFGFPFIQRHKDILCDLATKVNSGKLVYDNYVLFNKKYPNKNIDVFIEWWNEMDLP